MTLETPSELRSVTGLRASEIELIEAFMQGAIYSWIKNRKDEKFAARDLVGGPNSDWSDTPLQQLYLKHIHLGKSEEDAHDAAGKDLGWIMKSVIHKDKKCFRNIKEELVNKYILIE